MMKGKKVIITAILAAMISSVALFFNAVSAANEGVSLTNNGYALSSKYEVSLAFNQAGELNASKNGLRLKGVISASDYDGLKNLGEQSVIRYGILLAPQAYTEANALTAENVFGENRVYATDAAQIAEDEANGKETELIGCIEAEDLVKVGDNYVLYYTIPDFDDESMMDIYVAKAYVAEYTVDENRMVTGVRYNFVEGEQTVNMVYAVQKAIEDGKVGDYAEDLQTAYIDGKRQTIKVEYVTSYGGINPVSKTTEMTFDVGATVTRQDVLDKLTALDQSAFDLTTDFDSQKIYAGNTQDVLLTFNAKLAESKNSAIGMYTSGDMAVKIKANSIVCGTVEYDNYSLFGDGTIIVGAENSKFVLGKVDTAKGEFVTDDYTCKEVLELDEKMYAGVAGIYMYNGEVVRIYADGTADYDLLGDTETIKYLLAYDEANGESIIAFENSVAESFDESDCSVNGFTKVTLADAAAYTNAAGYYSCTTAGANLGKLYRFNVDGTIYSENAKVGAFMILSDGTVTANIGGNVGNAKVAISKSNYGVNNKTLNLKNNDGNVVMNLRNQSMDNYNDATKVVNNLFGKSEMVFYGSEKTDGVGSPRVRLTAAASNNAELAAITMSDGTIRWKHAEYGSSGWGYFYSGLSWYAEQTTPTGGMIHFRLDSEPGYDKKLVRYEITEDNEMTLDMTDYDPNGTGYDTQFQVLHADISQADCHFTTTATSIYDVFGSEYGSYYMGSLYTANGKADKARPYSSGIVLYNYPTTLPGHEGYYACEYWANYIGYVDASYTKEKIAYRIEYDYEKNVGTLIIKGQSDKKYPLGIANGVRFVDMRDPINGWDEWGDIKVADISKFVMTEKGYHDWQVDIDAIYPTIEYALSTAGKTFVNAGAATEQPEDTRTIYEKFAGLYKTRKYYHETGSWWWGIGVRFNADGSMYVTADSSKVGTYTLTEITDTFGEIRIKCSYPIVENEVGYYALIDGQYVLRLTNRAMLTAQNSYWDLTLDGCTFSTWNVFDEIAGNGSKTYTDGEATLTLNVPGTKRDDATRYEGAAFTLTDGETTLTANYDLIPTAIGAGKIVLNQITYSGDVPTGTLICMGDYKIVGENYVIVFTVNNKTYMFAIGGTDVVKAELYGKYYGTENITFTSAAEINFTSISTGTITENGVTASFAMEDGRIKLTYVKNGLDYIAIK